MIVSIRRLLCYACYVRTFKYGISLFDIYCADASVALGENVVLHLHGFDDRNLLTFLDRGAFAYAYIYYYARKGRSHLDSGSRGFRRRGFRGGSGGGGSKLTEEGRELLKKYRELTRRVQEDADRVFAEVFGTEL